MWQFWELSDMKIELNQYTHSYENNLELRDKIEQWKWLLKCKNEHFEQLDPTTLI
jgi:hypothetical protein